MFNLIHIFSIIINYLIKIKKLASSNYLCKNSSYNLNCIINLINEWLIIYENNNLNVINILYKIVLCNY